jgi:hypothetical protein
LGLAPQRALCRYAQFIRRLLWEISGNDRCHRILIFAMNAADGGLQSTLITGPEKRQRRVRVNSVEKLFKT